MKIVLNLLTRGAFFAGSMEHCVVRAAREPADLRTAEVLDVVPGLFDKAGNDITYFYESQLAGEAAPVEDIHFYLVEPRTLRASVTVRM